MKLPQTGCSIFCISTKSMIRYDSTIAKRRLVLFLSGSGEALFISGGIIHLMVKVKSGKLTLKQDLVLHDVVKKVERGEPMDIVGSVEKFYNVNGRKSAGAIARANSQRPNFRAALIESLTEKRILGPDSKTEGVLLEGLDAVTPKGAPDYRTRLAYVQEINKLASIYAPETKKNLNLKLDLKGKDLDKKINELQEQLS